MSVNIFIPYSPPLIGEEEIDEVIDTLRSNWITTGPKTAQFERDFAHFTGAPAALALNSCTAGLHTALTTLGIGTGDEVISTPMTFCATINVIEHVGAKPVLVDVEPDTLNIDAEKVSRAITPKTRAIMPVHFAGHPVDLDTINELARDNHLSVVEDAAHAIHAKYKGRMIGSGDNPVAFSFYATKNMTTAEGGMLTGSEDFLSEARSHSLHGMNRDAWKRYDNGANWFYEVHSPGFKYNMTDLQSAIGIWQLRKLAGFQQRRNEIAARYNEAFCDVEALELPSVRPEVETAWHLYTLRLRSGTLTIGRNQFIDELSSRFIGTSVHFIPIHLHPFYRDKYGFKPEDFPIAYSNYQRILSIPLNQTMSDQDVEGVISGVLDVVKTFQR